MPSKKISFTLDEEVVQELERRAAAQYGGNVSAAANAALRAEIDSGKGPMSKMFQFIAGVRDVLRESKIEATSPDNAVDWIIPSLGLGIEAKLKFTPGKAETATVASMAFTAGQRLCDEIWLVLADTAATEDQAQWERVARDFHICPVRVLRASALGTALKERAKEKARQDRAGSR